MNATITKANAAAQRDTVGVAEKAGKRMGSAALNLRSPISGLMLTGQDVAGPGVQASFMVGLMAAAAVDPGVWREMGR